MTVLIDAAELAEQIAAGSSPRLLDVRWALGGPPGLPLYRSGHIPGAVYVDLDTELARIGEATDGRHPLPELDTVQAAARRWGLHQGDAVVVYDDLAGMSAARAWWLLRYAGVSDVRLLNGGLAAWTRAGLALETGENHPPTGDIRLNYGSMPVLDIDDAAALPDAGTLLDARGAERYRGDSEPIDPRGGHIPGALSAPTADNLDPEGYFLPVEALEDRFAALGVAADAPVGVYCGSGITAAHEAIALTLAGFEPAVYPGSWSQWSNHPERPVATGAAPR